MSQFFDDAVSDIFTATWADENEVSIILIAAGADEAIDAASKRHNEDDAGNANGDTEGGQESAATVFAEAIHGEVEVCV